MCNMDTKKLCVMASMYEYNKDDFDVDKINSLHAFLDHFYSPSPRKSILSGPVGVLDCPPWLWERRWMV